MGESLALIIYNGLSPDDFSAESQRQVAALRPSIGSRYDHFQHTYRDDPAAFIHDCVDWEGGAPADYQTDIAERLVEHGRVSVRASHSIGKTAAAALALLWFALTRDGDDWKIPTTASNWRQLSKFLWPEVHKWARRLHWSAIGRPPFDPRTEMLTLNLRLATGEAFAMASDDSASMEGAHADRLMFIYDEAKAIPDETWDATEGAFAGQGEALALAISTPGPPLGRFYDIHARKPGYEDWDVRHVRKEEAIKAGRMSAEWVESRRRQWGEKSALFQNRVEGEFAASDEDSVIPLAWVESANQRWLEWQDAEFPGTPTTVGTDVGGGQPTGNPTVHALVFDQFKVKSLRVKTRADPNRATMEVAGEIVTLLRAASDAKAFIDIVGIGAGVVHRLREQGLEHAIGFSAGEGTTYKDRTGELRFVDKRSAGWWIVRELLDPEQNSELCLPPDDDLLGELTSPTWSMTSKGQVRVEAKKEVEKRLGRSTDRADAVMMALAGPVLVKKPKATVMMLDVG